MKKNQNKLCYFLLFFPPKFLHFCRMTHIYIAMKFVQFATFHLVNIVAFIYLYLDILSYAITDILDRFRGDGNSVKEYF